VLQNSGRAKINDRREKIKREMRTNAQYGHRGGSNRALVPYREPRCSACLKSEVAFDKIIIIRPSVYNIFRVIIISYKKRQPNYRRIVYGELLLLLLLLLRICRSS